MKALLSNVDLIRRFVFERQPVSADDIAAEVMKQMSSVKQLSEARDKYVIPVLTANPYFHKTEQGMWEIMREAMPEFKVLSAVMDEQHRLMYEREVRSKVAAKLGMKLATVVLDLEQASGLKHFGTYWGLEQWILVNDQAAEVLKQHTGGLSERDLLKHICDLFQIDPKVAILHLAGDKQKRFVADRKLWLLKEHYDKSKQQQQEKPVTLLELKDRSVELLLEKDFSEAQRERSDELKLGAAAEKSRLRKVLKKQAQDIIEQREDLSPKQEDLAARLSQVLSAAGIEEFRAKSFQRIEASQKERGLSTKERDEIQQFLDQLLELDTVGVGAPIASVISAPLSARKILDVLKLKYINYTRDRAMIPNEYYRLLVEILSPSIDESVLHPSCYEGNLAVELLSYLFDRLEGAAWSMSEDSNAIEIVEPDGAHYRLVSEDPALLEKARDLFMISQNDLLNYYLNYKYAGIEHDGVLARAARYITRLSGFARQANKQSGYESAYVVWGDYTTELPKIFGYPPNEDNEIPLRFEIACGNFTFVNDANLAAQYLDNSLKLLAPGGRCAVFVLQELLTLLKQHTLLGEFLGGMAVTHFIRLPLIEGRHKVILLIVQRLASSSETLPPIITAEIRDFKSANNLSHAMQKMEGEGELFQRVEPLALGNVIG